jgi:hypothetical protein
MDDNWTGFIPANPEVLSDKSSKRYREAQAANSGLNIRDRVSGPRTVPAPPPVPIKIERRNFGPAPVAYTSNTRRRD